MAKGDSVVGAIQLQQGFNEKKIFWSPSAVALTWDEVWGDKSAEIFFAVPPNNSILWVVGEPTLKTDAFWLIF
jgi:hypothetical protein